MRRTAQALPSLDDVRIYNRAPSATEVKQLCAMGKLRSAPSTLTRSERNHVSLPLLVQHQTRPLAQDTRCSSILSLAGMRRERSVAVHSPQFSPVKLIGRMIARRAPRPVPAAIVSAPIRARCVVAVPVRNATAPPVRMPTPSAAPRGLNNVRGLRNNRAGHNRSGVRASHRGGQAESANQRQDCHAHVSFLVSNLNRW